MRLLASRFRSFAALAAAAWCSAAAAEAPELGLTVAGSAVVRDGDTLEVVPDDPASPATAVRLWGIDAPERGAAGGRESRLALVRLIARRLVVCREVRGQRDRYGRMVGLCRAGGEDLAAALVAAGWARDWPKYSGGYYGESGE
ncbi:MAG: thermonuclease family protein [Pseudomonadota bacterium]